MNLVSEKTEAKRKVDADEEKHINITASIKKRAEIISQQQDLSTAKDHKNSLARKRESATVLVVTAFLEKHGDKKHLEAQQKTTKRIEGFTESYWKRDKQSEERAQLGWSGIGASTENTAEQSLP